MDNSMRILVTGAAVGGLAGTASKARSGQEVPAGRPKAISSANGLGAVTRAMETRAARNKITPITAGKKGSSSPKKRGFGFFDLFRRIGR